LVDSTFGAMKEELLLSKRIFKWDSCGYECDRDENAGKIVEMKEKDC
jgi:hypothetical protein